MPMHLPNRIDPWQLANNSEQLEGEITLALMPRLTQSLYCNDGLVKLSLAGGIDDQATRFLTGHIETSVKLICQRCLQPFGLSLAEDFQLGLVFSEDQVANLPKQYDPLLVAEELQLSELIEDELLLALPIAPMHLEQTECKVDDHSSTAQTQAEGKTSGVDNGAGANNPFAILSTLLKDE